MVALPPKPLVGKFFPLPERVNNYRVLNDFLAVDPIPNLEGAGGMFTRVYRVNLFFTTPGNLLRETAALSGRFQH